MNANMSEIVLVEEAKPKHVCPAGTHNALCVGVYDLGKQKSAVGWPDRRKMALMFETEDKITDGKLAGQPYRLSKIVSDSMNDKSTLITTLTSWLGRDPRTLVNGKVELRMGSLVGKPCMLTIAHKTTSDGDTQAVVTTVSSHMKGLPALTSTFNPNDVPEWIKKMQSQRLDPIKVDGPDSATVPCDVSEAQGPVHEAKRMTPENMAAEKARIAEEPLPESEEDTIGPDDVPVWPNE